MSQYTPYDPYEAIKSNQYLEGRNSIGDALKYIWKTKDLTKLEDLFQSSDTAIIPTALLILLEMGEGGYPFINKYVEPWLCHTDWVARADIAEIFTVYQKNLSNEQVVKILQYCNDNNLEVRKRMIKFLSTINKNKLIDSIKGIYNIDNYKDHLRGVNILNIKNTSDILMEFNKNNNILRCYASAALLINSDNNTLKKVDDLCLFPEIKYVEMELKIRDID